MKNVVIGILAHVDAGKTTMSEAMLYKSGKIRKLGRVDHKNAYLDNSLIERERGITIFSKQAVFDWGNLHVNLLDTPGHMDFSAEMERTLSVLDYAILVISGPDGVQAHTQTLWDLLQRYHIPTFVWVNKMDLTNRDVVSELCAHFGDGFVDFAKLEDEQLAELDEEALDKYLQEGSLTTEDIQNLILKRKLFPCFCGSALKLEGVEEFLQGLDTYIKEKPYGREFSAKVYKISHTEDGQRLSWIKVTGGQLHPKDLIGDEKVNQIRCYSGVKYDAVETAFAGNVYAFAGLHTSYIGQGLGKEHNADAPILEPVLSYRIVPPAGTDNFVAMKKLSQLAEEDPMLRIVWNNQLGEIEAQLMGEVQIEVLRELIKDRFDMDVTIDTGHIVYKETIASPVIGIGHFEPLRHYAEVHLLMEPLPAGTGMVFTSACSTDLLDLNWQRLILTNLMEKPHLGVLTCSPITDMKISIVAGRAHLKHTEGGDFRQASYRAVRQGLMQAQNVLLEPYYDYVLEVPSEFIGRAISDLKAMACSFDAPKEIGGSFQMEGRGPVSELQNYYATLISYTKGRGRISCVFAGHYPCHNTEKVVEARGYDPNRDVENTADSVFCSHGAGVNVKWNKVSEFAHMDSGIEVQGEDLSIVHHPKLRTGNMDFDEKELEAIMLREFGEIKRPQIASVTKEFGNGVTKKKTQLKKDYLIVDGYNMIYAWDELKVLAQVSMDSARDRLIELLASYRAYKGCELCLVFDAYLRKDNPGVKENLSGLHVVYTQEGESADAYIEALISEIGKNYQVRVATSDGMIQLSALRAGVIRLSAREYKLELDKTMESIRRVLAENNVEKISFAEIAKLKK